MNAPTWQIPPNCTRNVPNYCQISDIEVFFSPKYWNITQQCTAVTFAHADGAALPVLLIAIAAVLVTGEGRTLDTATHLTAVLVSPAGTTMHAMKHAGIKHLPEENAKAHVLRCGLTIMCTCFLLSTLAALNEG